MSVYAAAVVSGIWGEIFIPEGLGTKCWVSRVYDNAKYGRYWSHVTESKEHKPQKLAKFSLKNIANVSRINT